MSKRMFRFDTQKAILTRYITDNYTFKENSIFIRIYFYDFADFFPHHLKRRKIFSFGKHERILIMF